MLKNLLAFICLSQSMGTIGVTVITDCVGLQDQRLVQLEFSRAAIVFSCAWWYMFHICAGF